MGGDSMKKLLDGVYYDITQEESEDTQKNVAQEEKQRKALGQPTDRQLIEELQTKQEDLTLRQEDIELMIADAIGGAI